MTTEIKNRKRKPMENDSPPPKKKPKYEEPQKKVLLFYCEEAEDLAIAVDAESDLIERQSIQWGNCADGFPKICIDDLEAIECQKVAFLASFSSPAVIFEQMSVINELMQHSALSFTLVLPFFPSGTYEEKDEGANVHTVDSVVRILSGVPRSKRCSIELLTYDLEGMEGEDHLEFGYYILPCLQTAIELLIPQLLLIPEVAVAFPDEGAHKAFNHLFTGFPVIVCLKVHKGDHKTAMRLDQGEPKGYHVVIVDDLVQSGETLIECQKILTANGAKEVSAFVTHASFLNRSWEKFIHKNDGSENAFSHFWVTDSCPAAVKVLENRAPFRVLSLAKCIAGKLTYEYGEF